MFHNYFFLKRLAGALNERLTGLQLLECFSQNRNELVLLLGSEAAQFRIRANLEPIISLLQFPASFARAGRNSVDLFDELLGKKVRKVTAFEYERSFQIGFETGHHLIFKMHARRANVLLTFQDEVLDIFRKNLTQDRDLVPSSLHKPTVISKQQFDLHQRDPLSMIPALGKEAKIALEKMEYQRLDQQEKWRQFQKLLRDLEVNPIYLIEDGSPRISLLEKNDLETMDPVAAANWLYEKSTRLLFFEKEKEQISSQLKQRIRKSESYISKTRQKLKEIERARSPEEIANILMANLHRIQTGLSKIVLTDIYTNEPITIKLNTTLSPQKNAEVYYRKSKNRHQEIHALQENIRDKELLIDRLSKQILQLLETDSPKGLRKFKKQYGFDQKKKQKDTALPYHEHLLEQWHILVGKNSKSNDELTLKVANKNDLWLHAKDVPGSHVIIREIPGQNFPDRVIEFAASLAAANSKRKTDSLCPVMFTPRKYVRKVKGAPPGQVIVEKEEVLMVEPAGKKA